MTRTLIAVTLALTLSGCEETSTGGVEYGSDAGQAAQLDAGAAQKADATPEPQPPIPGLDARLDVLAAPPQRPDGGVDTRPTQEADARAMVDAVPTLSECPGRADSSGGCGMLDATGAPVYRRKYGYRCSTALPGGPTGCLVRNQATDYEPAYVGIRVANCSECSY